MESFRDVFKDVVRERRNVESVQLGSIIIPFIHMNSLDVFVYGGGTNVDALLTYMEWNNIKICGIFDKDKEKSEKVYWNGVKIFHTSMMKSHILNPSNTLIIINIRNLTGNESIKIAENFQKLGVEKFYVMDRYDYDQVTAAYSSTYNNRIDFYRTHIDALEKTIDLFQDDESRKTFIEYIKCFLQVGIYKRFQCDGRLKYFYGQNDNGNLEMLYTHIDNECWMNCGANIGDNIFLFYDLGLNARKIYAFEGDKKTYQILKQNLELLSKDRKICVMPVNLYIDKNMNWLHYLHDKVTLINADIEGNELDLLCAIKDLIIRDRPVLALCVYHKKEDLIDIPKFLINILNSYVYKLRKYEADANSRTHSEELVLYAIPVERIPYKESILNRG